MVILHMIIGYKTYMRGWIRRMAQYQRLPNVDFQADVANKTWTEIGADVSQDYMVAKM